MRWAGVLGRIRTTRTPFSSLSLVMRTPKLALLAVRLIVVRARLRHDRPCFGARSGFERFADSVDPPACCRQFGCPAATPVAGSHSLAADLDWPADRVLRLVSDRWWCWAHFWRYDTRDSHGQAGQDFCDCPTVCSSNVQHDLISFDNNEDDVLADSTDAGESVALLVRGAARVAKTTWRTAKW